MESESLDAILRIRCEPELKERIYRIAKARRGPVAAGLIREVLWEWIRAEETRLGIGPPDPVPDKSKAMRTAQATQDDAEHLALNDRRTAKEEREALQARLRKITKYPHGNE